MDLVALLATATPADISQARAAVGLITQRGFHRSKDLDAELDSWLGRRC